MPNAGVTGTRSHAWLFIHTWWRFEFRVSVSQNILTHQAVSSPSVFIRHLSSPSAVVAGRWLSGTRDKVGLRITLVLGTFYRMCFLLLFTVLAMISVHLNLPVFNTSVYFLMSPRPPYWSVLSGKAKILVLGSRVAGYQRQA